VVTIAALVVRLLVAVWAGATFPPTADGTYYHLLATRIASGKGYTWLWPDGVVTHAAHYPVGYPALIAGAYVVLGAKPIIAMIVNALIGAAGAWAAHDLLRRATSPRLALAGGLAVALHPALVPYTAALMTEGVATALLVVAAAFAERAFAAEKPTRGMKWTIACGAVMGIATLTRPQLVVLAPLFGWLAARAGGDPRRGARGAVIVTLVALGMCAPWTARNCVRMQQCALVSVNGGWNLAIGTQTDNGGWHELAVPDACKEVFAEAAKDECFGREARAVIARDPIAWLSRMPAKLRVTFDYFGAAPWYLNAANAQAFPYSAKVALGTVETIASRLLLLAALVAARKLPGPRRLAREGATAVGLVACVIPGAGVIAYLACATAIVMVGRRELARAPRIVPITAAVVLVTAATHAAFFGAGRYGLVVVPFIAALAFARPERAK
jgi:4-amino-4-deoxy-L-arabinose transferase-like glycosyltransferase